MSFDDRKLRTKTLIPLIAMAAVFACVVGVGTFKLNNLATRYSVITSGVDPAMLRLSKATQAAYSVGRDVYEAIGYDSNNRRSKQAIADFAAEKDSTDQLFDDASRMVPAKAKAIKDLKDSFDALYETAKAPLAIGESTPGMTQGSKLAPKDLDQMAAAIEDMADVDSQINDLTSETETLNSAIAKEDATATAALRKDADDTTAMMIGLGLLSIIGGLVFSIWIVNSKIAAPLGRLSERMKRLAGGDLSVEIQDQGRADEVGDMAKAVQVFKDNALKGKTVEVEAGRLREASESQRTLAEREGAARAAELAKVVESVAGGLQKLADGVLTHRLNDAFAAEYEQLRQDFNAAMAKVQAALGAVINSAQGINAGAGEITQAADDLSRRTEQQAASLEETAAALDEITATVRKTAEGAQHARGVVGKAKVDAQVSGEIVEGAEKAMGAIARSSSEIGQIIGVIDEIAFQTNLLALNAGVEAARAGDAGRGFAVVAQEVRALAQRSADAAKAIKTLISTSAKEVGDGVQLVGEAGKALKRIADQVAEINAIVEDITHSAQEQATGLAEVNTAVNQMDQMTQQNAAMVEESTAASHGLAQEAQALTKLTQGFQVGKPAAAPAPVRNQHPVHAARGRIAGFAGGGRSNAAVAVAENWEEF